MRLSSISTLAATAVFFFGMTILLPVFASKAEAATYFNVSPKVVNVKSKAREIDNLNLTLKNTSGAVLPIYVTLVDIDPEKGKMLASGADTLAATPSRWFEIARTQELLPHEEQSTILRLSVPGQAKSGTYNVLMRLSTDASGKCADCAEEIPVTIDVADDVREVMQLSSFSVAKDVFMGGSADFNLRVENTGNRALAPTGKIRIFDKRGEEVGAVDVNASAKSVDPKAQDMLAASWAADGHFGRYKALLDVSYGQRGIMQDTVYFWVIPWGRLMGMFATIVIVLGFGVVMVRGRSMAGAYTGALGGEYYDAAYDDSYEEPSQARVRAKISVPVNAPTTLAPRANPFAAQQIARKSADVQSSSVAIAPRQNAFFSSPTVMVTRHSHATSNEVAIAPRVRPDMSANQISLGKREKVVAPEHQIRL